MYGQKAGVTSVNGPHWSWTTRVAPPARRAAKASGIAEYRFMAASQSSDLPVAERYPERDTIAARPERTHVGPKGYEPDWAKARGIPKGHASRDRDVRNENPSPVEGRCRRDG